MNIMTQHTATPLHYDTKTIWLHWLTAVLVIALWAIGQTIDWFPRGTPRTLVRSLHISSGALLALILVYRIWWRSTAGARLAPASTGAANTLAKLIHLAIYAAMIATLVLGIANTWIRGDNLFDLVKIPAFDPGNKELRESVEELHGLAANLLLILAAFHATAGRIRRPVRPACRARRMRGPRASSLGP